MKVPRLKESCWVLVGCVASEVMKITANIGVQSSSCFLGCYAVQSLRRIVLVAQLKKKKKSHNVTRNTVTVENNYPCSSAHQSVSEKRLDLYQKSN